LSIKSDPIGKDKTTIDKKKSVVPTETIYGVNAKRFGIAKGMQDGKPLWASILKGLSVSTVLLAKTIEEPEVNSDIDDDNHGTKEVLYFSCELGRIDDSKKVVLHETFTISGSSRLDKQCILQAG
jgi:hypothetical protein